MEIIEQKLVPAGSRNKSSFWMCKTAEGYKPHKKYSYIKTKVETSNNTIFSSKGKVRENYTKAWRELAKELKETGGNVSWADRFNWELKSRWYVTYPHRTDLIGELAIKTAVNG